MRSLNGQLKTDNLNALDPIQNRENQFEAGSLVENARPDIIMPVVYESIIGIIIIPLISQKERTAIIIANGIRVNRICMSVNLILLSCL